MKESLEIRQITSKKSRKSSTVKNLIRDYKSDELSLPDQTSQQYYYYSILENAGGNWEIALEL